MVNQIFFITRQLRLMQIAKLSQILIRLAQPQDRQKIIQLEKLAVRNLCQNSYDTAQIDTLTENIHRLHFNDEVIVVAEKNNIIIGFASLLSYRQIVRTLYVEPKFGHQQISTKLLNAIEQEAIKKRINILKVTSSLAERAFYNSQGYQEIAMCNLGKMDILAPGIAMEKKLVLSRYNLLFKALSQMTLASIPNLFFLLLFM